MLGQHQRLHINVTDGSGEHQSPMGHMPVQQPMGLAWRADLRLAVGVLLVQLPLDTSTNSGLAQHLQMGILASQCSGQAASHPYLTSKSGHECV